MAKSLAVWVSNSNDKPLNVPKNDEPEQAEAEHSDKAKDETEIRSDRPEIELHINYWVLNDKNLNRKKSPTKENTWIQPFKFFAKFSYKILDLLTWLISFAKERETTNYLDVGVKFTKTQKEQIINIFFPFNIQPRDYDSQLGLKVANDVLLLSTIFNSEVQSIAFKDNLYHHSDVNFLNASENKDDRVRFYTNIDLQEDENNPLGSGVRLHDVNDEGSILSFPLKNFRLDDDIDGYFRFRLILDPISKKALSTYYVPSDSFMLTTEESMEIIDFRVNEIRNTPENVNSLQTFRGVLKRVHFFIIREVKSEYVMSDKSYHRSRLLEGDLWKKYLQSHHIKPIKDVPKMLIFHWKSGESSKTLENFSAFAKFRHTRRSLWIILRSIVIGLVFSIFANWLYDLIKS
ncbi:hypothetical protein PO856_004105 [Pectobacterium brasiliense]|uniref:hypothetical protein n=1 Tax=Pectobacterium brasiliense TaxID=180957 RepID=UPI0024059AA8|nr:hypothetical protein [Pectobacterium brasiliense]MDG0806816.1 hypothetical protein [Pectobacterium brasiliense]